MVKTLGIMQNVVFCLIPIVNETLRQLHLNAKCCLVILVGETQPIRRNYSAQTGSQLRGKKPEPTTV